MISTALVVFSRVCCLGVTGVFNGRVVTLVQKAMGSNPNELLTENLCHPSCKWVLDPNQGRLKFKAQFHGI